MLVVVCGLPGTGKSTVAERAADRLDARLLRSDVVRKELFPDPEYTTEESRATYEELLARAGDALEGGHDVVLDATFRRAELRGRAAAVAEAAGDDWLVLKVECDEAVVRERIAGRVDDESDADFAIYRQLKDEFEPVEADHVVVDNSGAKADTMARVDDLFAETAEH